MKWQFKLMRNSLFALVPFPSLIRKLKRKLIPYPYEINLRTLEQGLKQLEILKAFGISLGNSVVLELGTGWHPVIPLIFYLAGAKRIILIDKQKLTDKKLLIRVVNNLKKYKQELSNRILIREDDIENRLSITSYSKIDDIFGQFNMEYLAPFDARKTGLPDGSVAAITSTSVLQYIHPNIITDILLEFNRILADDGVMCHIIDNSDHWEHGDPSISKLNFLKYEENVWKFIGKFICINALDYKNRLRHFEYLALFNKCGFKVIADCSKADEKAMSDLKNMKICRKYQNIDPRELAILTSDVVLMKE